jgi:type I restriction enzyme, R subunit
MTTQPEQTLENNLISQLQQLGYGKVLIPDETALLANLKVQLEKHNKTQLSEWEFTQILNAINKGNVFERAKILRDRVVYVDDSGEHRTVELINQVHWCQNQFQVAQQISMKGLYKNRFDVTILVNGLPMVQVELK